MHRSSDTACPDLIQQSISTFSQHASAASVSTMVWYVCRISEQLGGMMSNPAAAPNPPSEFGADDRFRFLALCKDFACCFGHSLRSQTHAASTTRSYA
ncbi:MAG: hypothetical protein K0U11_06805 [Gammaproteobacteria bacterium]|nr:hypothetical protein [Gammaproteobacteria bacterium]